MVPHRGYQSRRQCLAKKPHCSSVRQYPVLEVLLERWGEEQEQARAQSEERREPRSSGEYASSADEPTSLPRSPRYWQTEGGASSSTGQLSGQQLQGSEDDLRRWPPHSVFNTYGLPLRRHLATLPEAPEAGTARDQAAPMLPRSQRRPLEEMAALPDQHSSPCSPVVERGRIGAPTHDLLREERTSRPHERTPHHDEWSLISFSSLPTEQSVELSEAQDPSERASERDQAPSERDGLTSDDEGSLHSALMSRRSLDEREPPVLFHAAHRQ